MATERLSDLAKGQDQEPSHRSLSSQPCLSAEAIAKVEDAETQRKTVIANRFQVKQSQALWRKSPVFTAENAEDAEKG